MIYVNGMLFAFVMSSDDGVADARLQQFGLCGQEGDDGTIAPLIYRQIRPTVSAHHDAISVVYSA